MFNNTSVIKNYSSNLLKVSAAQTAKEWSYCQKRNFLLVFIRIFGMQFAGWEVWYKPNGKLS